MFWSFYKERRGLAAPKRVSLTQGRHQRLIQGPKKVTNTLFGGFLIVSIVSYHIPQIPIRTIKAPVSWWLCAQTAQHWLRAWASFRHNKQPLRKASSLHIHSNCKPQTLNPRPAKVSLDCRGPSRSWLCGHSQIDKTGFRTHSVPKLTDFPCGGLSFQCVPSWWDSVEPTRDSVA